MGHTGLGRELEGLLPVKNLLPSNVSLEKGCWIEFEKRGEMRLTELLTKGGYLGGGPGISCWVASNGDIRPTHINTRT